MKDTLIPDGTGTIALGGFEPLVDSFLIKHDYLEAENTAFDELKERLRGHARTAILAAVKAGAKRAFLRASKRGGALITLPDYSAASNRPVFSDKKMSSIMKEGGLEALGLKPEEIFEEERDAGGETIVLRGKWIEWFQTHFAERLTSGDDPDISHTKQEPTVTRRVRAAALPMLEAAACAGSAVAQLLVSTGFKALTVRCENK